MLKKSPKSSKKVAPKEVVPKKTKKLSSHEVHFLSVLALFLAFSVWALGSFVTTTNRFIEGSVTNDVLNADGVVVHEEEPDYVSKDNPFEDTAGHSNELAIKALYYEGIISGYDDGTFKPDNKVLRAEFAKMAMEALKYDYTKLPATSLGSCFTDVKSGDWFEVYVCTMKYEKFVSGYTDGSFKPGSTIVKAEAVKILVEAFDISNSSSTPPTPSTSPMSNSPYSDVNSSDWFYSYAQAAKTSGLISNGGLFNATQEVTRGQMSQMIFNALKYKGLL